MQSYRSAWLQGSYTGNGGGAGAATWLLRATGCSSFGRQSKHVGHLVESGWACPLSNQRWREEVLAGYPPPPVCHILERTYWAECFTSFAKWEAGRGHPRVLTWTRLLSPSLVQELGLPTLPISQVMCLHANPVMNSQCISFNQTEHGKRDPELNPPMFCLFLQSFKEQFPRFFSFLKSVQWRLLNKLGRSIGRRI